MPRTSRTVLAVALVVGLLVGACSDDDPDDAVPAAVADFTPNRARWDLPLDAYDPDAIDAMARASYAENLLIAACLAEKGVDHSFAVAPVPGGDSPTSANDRRLFDVAIATEFGYRSAPPRSGVVGWRPAEEEAMREFDALLASDPSVQGLWDDCLDDARGQLRDPRFGRLLEEVHYAAGEAAASDSAVQVALDRWRECVSALGIADLPAEPEEMPGPTLSAEFGYGRGDEEVPSQFLPPTAREVEVAVADAECRESSGYSEARYDAEVRAQLEAIAEHEDDLERLRIAIERFSVDVDEVIDRLGPTYSRKTG